jgi:hypothetical protein
MLAAKTCRIFLLPSDLLFLSPMVTHFRYGASLIVVSSVRIVGMGINVVIIVMLACPEMAWISACWWQAGMQTQQSIAERRKPPFSLYSTGHSNSSYVENGSKKGQIGGFGPTRNNDANFWSWPRGVTFLATQNVHRKPGDTFF